MRSGIANEHAALLAKLGLNLPDGFNYLRNGCDVGLARDIVVKRKITKNIRDTIRGNLYNQELVVQYTVENFKNTPVVLDIVENMNNLRNELCGGKTVDAEWEILKSETTVPQEQIERKNSSTVEYHVPLDAAPKGDGQVKKSVVTVHVLLRNEW